MNNGLMLLDGTELKKLNATFRKDIKTLEIEFDPEHSSEEIASIFSPLGDKYNLNNLKEITMIENNQPVGHWIGYCEVDRITTKVNFVHSPTGERPQKREVSTVALKQESLSDTYIENAAKLLDGLLTKIDMQLRESEVKVNMEVTGTKSALKEVDKKYESDSRDVDVSYRQLSSLSQKIEILTRQVDALTKAVQQSGRIVPMHSPSEISRVALPHEKNEIDMWVSGIKRGVLSIEKIYAKVLQLTSPQK